jgi:tRNA(Ile)-lysidine synthase
LRLDPWDDPHNRDPAYARARVRHQAMPALTAALGPGIAEALARSAGQLRADADVLDALAGAEFERIQDGNGGLEADELTGLPAAIRTRVLRAAAAAAGCPAGALTARHVASLDALVTGWHGQRWADLPGGIRGLRRCGKLLFTAGSRTGAGQRAGAPAREPGLPAREPENAEGAGGRD